MNEWKQSINQKKKKCNKERKGMNVSESKLSLNDWFHSTMDAGV
jgi:hypothetical protein